MNIPVLNGNLPSGFCPSSYQNILNGFSAVQYISLDTAGNRVAVSTTKPTDTTVVWLRLDSFGRPLRYYYFSQGAWLSLHPTVPGLTMWWFNDAPDLTTFDGGDSNPLSDISGPMWQLAKNKDGTVIAARFPIVAGTLPSTTVLAPGDTGGAETHTLTVAEIPAHSHQITPIGRAIADGNLADPNGGLRDIGGQPIQTDNTGGGKAHAIMPPWVCGVLLQRTGRLYFSVT